MQSYIKKKKKINTSHGRATLRLKGLDSPKILKKKKEIYIFLELS